MAPNPFPFNLSLTVASTELETTITSVFREIFKSYNPTNTMSSERRPFGTIVYQSFIIALILIIVVLGVSYYNSNQNIITQKSTINSLTVKLNSTTLDNTRLQSNVTSLTSEKKALQTQLSTLTTDEASLKSQLTKLSSNVTALTDEVKGLNDQLGVKNIEVSNLTGVNSNLRSQLTSLNTQVGSLQTRLSNQTSIVNMGKNVILENDKHITISASTSSYLSYRTSFAGYIGVSLVSTGGVSFDMGSSQVSDTWFGTYPRSGTVDSGSFKVPVMPGTTYIKITNPSMSTDVVVYFYLTYVY